MPRKPKVGDWADHKSGTLDPRPVHAVLKEEGKPLMIQLSFSGTPSETWFPASNYTFKEPRS